MVANDSTPDGIKASQVVTRSGVVLTERKKGSSSHLLLSVFVLNVFSCTLAADFSAKDLIQDMNRLLQLTPGTSSSAYGQTENHQFLSMCALCALCALWRYNVCSCFLTAS